MKINELKPQNVWGYFGEICTIPHPSKHEAAIMEHLCQFAKSHSLKIKQDEIGNILIIKDGSQGYENHDAVILQAHVDMVPQKNSDVTFDFEKDAIRPYVDGDWVTAQETTLGADNGIGCAAMLAVLADKTLKHPPIEALFTIDEETGLTGANALSSNMLTGKILFNLDSEDEGELYVGCAGAVNNTATLNYKTEPSSLSQRSIALDLRGLKGGHSGMEIVLQRGNANKLLVRFLREQQNVNQIRISTVDGGGLRNAIPREARAIITVAADRYDFVMAEAQKFEKSIQNEFSAVEDSISFKATGCPTAQYVIVADDQRRIIAALTAAPSGVSRMSDAMHGLVETSTNMSRVEIQNGVMTVLFMTRCMVNYGKRELSAMIRSVFELAGATVIEQNDYDGWAPDMNSPILATMSQSYRSLYGKTPAIKAIHAGLECGIIGAKYPSLDMISFGPTIRFPHSPDEKVNIESVAKFYEFLTYTLSKL